MKLLAKNSLAIAGLRYSRNLLASSLALSICALGCWMQPAQAEGSKELTNSGGDRPFLEFSNSTNAGILRRTVIKVYANAGEMILLGSSAHGINLGLIRYRNPSGTQATCSTAGVTGRIQTRVQEVAGPLPNAGGYTPCSITVPAGQGGVWEVDFISPAGETALNNPTAIAANANWTAQATANGFVTAWDVTVRNSANTATIPGRAFTKYIALNMGGNSRSLSSKVTVLTRDGYQYGIDANGLDPFGFIFYADDNGFTSSGKSIYRSIQLILPNPGTLPSGIAQPAPGAADSITDTTHKIFFNTPDASMPGSSTTPSGSTWLYSLPVPPPTPSSFTFTGIDGTPGQAGTALGGNFSFNASSPGPYRLIVDVNQNNILGDGNDKILVGEAVAGNNIVPWNGTDGNNNPIPATASFYRTTITLYAGEIHFPLIDAETNPNGIIFERLNNPTPATSPVPNAFTVYFDDRATNPALDSAAGPTTNSLSPLNGLGGVDSSLGGHDYQTNFGNIRGIDTWTYYPSQEVELIGGITVVEADFSITKSHSPNQIVPGETITYTITVTNNSTTIFGESAVVVDSFDPALSNISWTCAVTNEGTGSGTSSCANTSGTGNINSNISLKAGGVATFTVNATLAPSFTGNSLSNTATISRSFDAADPNTTNNTANDTATITQGADLRLSKTHTGNFIRGSVGTYAITATNSGNAATSGIVTVSDTLPTGLIPTAASGNGWICVILDQTVTCTRSDALAVNTSYPAISIAVSVAQSAAASLINTATVSGGTDANTTNNSASDPTITVGNSPSLLLVKRITAVNGVSMPQTPPLFQDLTIGSQAADDNHPNWALPADTYLRGELNHSNIKPGDEIEYTIYFLNTQSAVRNVTLCDVVPDHLTFVPTGYSSASPHPTESGALPTNTGIAIALYPSSLTTLPNPPLPTVYLTNMYDGDRGRFYPANDPSTPSICKKFDNSGNEIASGAAANTSGAVVVKIVESTDSDDTLPAATGQGTPPRSYGFIRFKAKVN